MEAVEAHPDQRFGQLLINLSIVTYNEHGELIDPFSEESTTTLRRVKKRRAVSP